MAQWPGILLWPREALLGEVWATIDLQLHAKSYCARLVSLAVVYSVSLVTTVEFARAKLLALAKDPVRVKHFRLLPLVQQQYSESFFPLSCIFDAIITWHPFLFVLTNWSSHRDIAYYSYDYELCKNVEIGRKLHMLNWTFESRWMLVFTQQY